MLGQYSDDEEEDEDAADQPTGEAKGSPGDASAQVFHIPTLSCQSNKLNLLG